MKEDDPSGRFDGGQAGGGAATASGETRIPLASLFGNPPRSVGMVLPGLAEKTVGGIVAPGGLGKSMVALETCMSIGVGQDLFGIWGAPLAQGRTVYLGFEDPADILRSRLYSVAKALTKSRGEAVMKALDEAGCEFHSFFGKMPPPSIVRRKGRHALERDPWFERLKREVRSRGPVQLMVVDTLNRAVSAGGVDENSNIDMSQVLQVLEAAGEELGCAVVFVHHVSKGTAAAGRGGDQRAARGAGAITDNARWQVNLSAAEEADRLILELTKANYGGGFAPRTLTRKADGVLVGPDFNPRRAKAVRAKAETVVPADPAADWDDGV
jgi:RecA-family ATPase